MQFHVFGVEALFQRNLIRDVVIQLMTVIIQLLQTDSNEPLLCCKMEQEIENIHCLTASIYDTIDTIDTIDGNLQIYLNIVHIKYFSIRTSLVGALEHEFYDLPLGISSSQLTNSLHHFSEGWRKTTNQVS